MKIKRFFDICKEMKGIHDMSLQVDMDKWYMDMQTFNSYSEFVRFVDNELNDSASFVVNAKIIGDELQSKSFDEIVTFPIKIIVKEKGVKKCLQCC